MGLESFFKGLFGDDDIEEPEEPLVLGAKLECLNGEHESFLFVESDTIDLDDLPEACVTDNEALLNILPFGKCYAGTDCANIMEIEEEWENKEKQTKEVNEKAIITTKSTLRCNRTGMFIKVITSGQEGEGAEQFIFFREMEEKYPGLSRLLVDPYGSVYLEDGMYEMALEFLSDMMKERGGKIDLFKLDSKNNFKDIYIKAAIERLVPSCDVSSAYKMNEGLRTAIVGSGVRKNMEVQYLDKDVMEALKAIGKANAKKAKDDPFFRWQEEKKCFLSIAAEGTTAMAYAVAAHAYESAQRSKVATKSSVSEGTSGAEQGGSYRYKPNTGKYSKLKEPMDIDYVKQIAKDAGIGYDGVKINIIDDPSLIGKGVYGYTHPGGKVVDLYPDAFMNKETLIKTLGHERIHVFQQGLYGSPTDSNMGQMFEDGAYGSEDMWWSYYEQYNGGK